MTDAISAQSNIMQQSVRQAYSNVASMTEKGSRSFWEQQMQLLDSMEAFANGWFTRRHAGVQAALETCERMTQATMPPECLHAYQSWAAGALERVMADCTDCQREFGNFMRVVAPSLAPVIEGKRGSDAQADSPKRARVSEAT